MTKKAENTLFYLIMGLIVTVTYLLVYANISSTPIMDWDEARHGVNAFEMIQNNNYLVHTYDGEVDYYNLKPPLSMWQIVLPYRLFGFNLIGLRFFSALYLVVITVASMLFMKRTFGLLAAVGSGLFFMLFMPRFMHLFGTADPDALHVFLCFWICVCLYYSLDENPKYLIGAGLLLSLDFLDKATHVVCMAAVILLAIVLLRKSGGFPDVRLLAI